MSLLFSLPGSWTQTADIVSPNGDSDFSNAGVAVYGSRIAVGSSDSDAVEIFDDTGSLEDSVSVSSIENVAMYDDVLAAHADDTIFVFERISGAWTAMSSYTSTGTFKNVQMYSNWIVAGNKG